MLASERDGRIVYCSAPVMGPQNNSSSTVYCKRCKAKLVNGLKCSDCENSYHRSCAKSINSIQFIDEETIKCCKKSEACETVSILEHSSENSVDIDEDFRNALSELSDSDNKIDVRIFNYMIKQKDEIIKQKDIIISELQDKIKLLVKQAEMPAKSKIVDVITNSSEFDDFDQCTSANKEQTYSIKLDKLESVASMSVNLNNVCTAIESGNELTDKSRLKTCEVIRNDECKIQDSSEQSTSVRINTNLYSDIVKGVLDRPNTDKVVHSHVRDDYNNSGNEWKTVQPKKRTNSRVQIVGNNKCSGIKTVPKCVDLHVYRIDPDITVTDIKRMLISKFPEVICEQLFGKNTKQYSSFKVTIYESNFRNAMSPSIWPYGACIIKFLHIRQRLPPKE
ncbi:hypothetical protein ANN_19161 [Periplaneta americana]|uniref:Phorbol-ester/DAG-type domain-containing protein n=1 Tax=Periplaneta americana TaxID=6978 RepID=A0ABQ8S935_PERAM|nr:hypothetical protein ANN_19161 [Periplaneta americana]